MLDETESKTLRNDEEGDQWRKSKTLREVKPVENISKNPQRFSRDKSRPKASPSST